MTNIYQAPVRKTISGMTASQLLNNAKLMETQAGTFMIAVGDLELHITDDYWMIASDFGTCLGQMKLTDAECDALTQLEADMEEKYEEVNMGAYA